MGPPGEGIAVGQAEISFPVVPWIPYWWHWWAPAGLETKAGGESRARAPPTSMQRRNLNSSTCGSRMWSLWGEGSKAIKCKTRAEQSKGLSASVRDTGISVNRERKLKAVSTYCKAL